MPFYKDPITKLTYPSKAWMFSHIKNLPEVQRAYPEKMTTPAPTPAPAPQPALKTHEVKKGETLWGISEKYLGAGSRWRELGGFEGDPKKLQIGTTLTIPAPAPAPAPLPPAPKAPPPPKIKPVVPEPPAKDLILGMGVDMPEIPKPAIIADTKIYTENLLPTLEKQKQDYQNELERYRKKYEEEGKEAEARIKEYEEREKVMLEEDVKPLLEPWREKKREAERKRWKVEEYYTRRGKLVDEVEGLLTALQNEVTAAESVTGLQSIRVPRIQKLKADVQARVSIINASFAAYDGQLQWATNLIDETISDIEYDKAQELKYYEKVMDFYKDIKDTEGNRLLALNKNEREFIEKQISFIREDVKISQESVDFIKEKLISPQWADLMASAGITLLDTIPQINEKLSQETYRREIVSIHDEMLDNDYEFLATLEEIRIKQADPNVEVKTRMDSRGNVHTYWKAKEVAEAEAPGVVSGIDVDSAGILIETEAGEQFDISTVEGLESLREAEPEIEYEDLRAWLDLNTKLTLSSIDGLLEGAGYISVGEEAEERARTYNNVEIMDQVRDVLKNQGVKYPVASFLTAIESSLPDITEKDLEAAKTIFEKEQKTVAGLGWLARRSYFKQF